MIRLADELQAGTWRPGPYRTFTVSEPKVRNIAAAPFPDRVVHHALCNVLEPLFEAASIEHSYACRPGKGMHAAAAQARALLCRHGFYLKADVRRFFESIPHEPLMRLVGGLVDEPRTLALVRTILANQPPGATAGRGLPIGNLTSQHLANLCLGPLDRAMTGAVGEERYLRYMDDFVAFGPSKDELFGALGLARRVLAADLGLELKEAASFVAPAHVGLPFLGLRIFRGTVRLGHAARSRFLRGWRTRSRTLTGDAFLASAGAAVSHVRHASTYALRQQVIA